MSSPGDVYAILALFCAYLVGGAVLVWLNDCRPGWFGRLREDALFCAAVVWAICLIAVGAVRDEVEVEG